MVITSRQNAVVRSVAALKDKKERAKRGEYLAEGEKAVREAVEKGLNVTLILGTTEAVSPYFGRVERIVEADKTIVAYCADAVTPQDILAVIAIPDIPLKKPCGVSVVLDGVKDPGNVGTVIRTCAALGVKNVYLVDCADAYSPKCVRSSMCGIYSVNVFEIERENAEEFFKGANVVVADMGGEDVFTADVEGEFCLVIGSESHGVSETFLRIAKRSLSLAMSNDMESLNAAIACSVILYAILKKPI